MWLEGNKQWLPDTSHFVWRAIAAAGQLQLPRNINGEQTQHSPRGNSMHTFEMPTGACNTSLASTVPWCFMAKTWSGLRSELGYLCERRLTQRPTPSLANPLPQEMTCNQHMASHDNYYTTCTAHTAIPKAMPSLSKDVGGRPMASQIRPNHVGR